jgi:outer membrane protein OmpA-like peptidoglycan-associated protein
MAHETGEPKNLLILGVGLASVVVLGAVMVGLQSYFYEVRDAEQQVKVLGKQNAALLELHAKEQKRLTTAAYLDKSAGKVRIPIDVAMAKLAEKGRKGVPSIQAVPSDAACGNAPTTAAASGTAAAPAAPAAPTAAPFPATKAVFALGEKKLSDEAKKNLGAALDYLKANPEAKIALTGYTDKTGDETKNKEVAKDRAKAVREFFTKGGIDKARIEMAPPASLTGTGSDADARRVEVMLQGAPAAAPAGSGSAAPAAGSAPAAAGSAPAAPAVSAHAPAPAASGEHAH